MKCKACNADTTPSKHPNFALCSKCGCYSNVLEWKDQSSIDFYNDVYENLEGWKKQLDGDLKHWNKLFKKFSHTLPSGVERIIDIAGGIGLPSSVIQGFLKVPVTIVDRSINEQMKTIHSDDHDNMFVIDDVFHYLESISISTSPILVYNSHFIEHLEIDDLRRFMLLVKQKFPGSTFITYCPSAGSAKGKEKEYLHFNTNVPSEHRIVWSKGALNSEIEKAGIKITHSENFDMDIYIVGQL